MIIECDGIHADAPEHLVGQAGGDSAGECETKAHGATPVWPLIDRCRNYIDRLERRRVPYAREHGPAAAPGHLPSRSEQQHHAGNLASIIQALAFQTLEANPSPEAFKRVFLRRAGVLARMQKRLQGGRNLCLRETVEAEIATLLQGRLSGSVDLDGPDGVELPREGAAMFALAIHELAVASCGRQLTCGSQERVSVYWALQGPFFAPQVALHWTAFGMDADAADPDWAFGRELILWGLPYALDAGTRLDWSGDCLTCVMRLPVADVH